MIKDYVLFALRNIKRKGLRSYLTLIGIFIGIMAVVALISLGNAMKQAVTSQFGVQNIEVITVQAGGLQYGPPGSSVANPLTKGDLEEIRKISSVEFAIGRDIGTIKIEYNDIQKITSAYSVEEDYEEKLYEIGEIESEYGRLLRKGDSGKVVLGSGFYDGETNGFKKQIVPGKRILLDGESYEVIGILEKKGSLLLDQMILLYDKELKELTNKNEESVDLISVKVKDKSLINKTKEDIEKLLRRRRNVDEGEENFEVTTPESTLATVNDILGAIQIFIIIIALISILVGAIGIINTMITSVMERRKEIGIMKSIGSRNFQIFMIFFIESGFLGLIGGAIGVSLGILAGYGGTAAINNWIGSSIKPTLDVYLILFSLIGSFAIGSIAGIVPALKAARQKPVEALRG